MIDDISHERLRNVNPRLATAIRQMAEMLAQENIFFRVTQGLRPWSIQDSLFAQGRTLAGEIITHARGGESWHNFGMAVDLAVERDGGIDWNADHPAWKRMIQVGEMLGLYSGSHFRTFPDNPHFQMTGSFPISPNDEVRMIFKHVGMEGVWVEAGLFDRGEVFV